MSCACKDSYFVVSPFVTPRGPPLPSPPSSSRPLPPPGSSLLMDFSKGTPPRSPSPVVNEDRAPTLVTPPGSSKRRQQEAAEEERPESDKGNVWYYIFRIASWRKLLQWKTQSGTKGVDSAGSPRTPTCIGTTALAQHSRRWVRGALGASTRFAASCNWT